MSKIGHINNLNTTFTAQNSSERNKPAKNSDMPNDSFESQNKKYE